MKSHGDGKFKLSDFSVLGSNVVFERDVLVFHPGNIEIGNDVYIGHQTILKGYYKNKMVIGHDTWIGQQCFFHGAGGLFIGNNVGIGPAVKIITSSHSAEDVKKPIVQTPLIFEKVVIENNCDIGVGTIILPGVIIGENSILGAGSVVTKDIPPNSIAVGNPAKVIKSRQ